MQNHEILRYRPAELHTGKIWYVSFYAFNPLTGKLKEKRIKINRVKNIRERRKWAYEIMNEINKKLLEGWNPWIEANTKKGYATFEQALNHFKNTYQAKLNDGTIREETHRSYLSQIHQLELFIKDLHPIHFIYQFDRSLINQFLDHIYLEKENKAQTRDNYLAMIRIFGGFLMEKEYLKTLPTNGIKVLGKRKHFKERVIIPEQKRKALGAFLNEENPHYLLACMVMYYCFIRPKEMSYIKVKHINWKEGTLFIPGSTAKNHKDAAVTIPSPLGKYFLEMEVHKYPGDYYIFSEGFKPGPSHKESKHFRDYWGRRIRKALNFPASYKFYSLKDSGITDLIILTNPLTARDQARHHSIAITDVYTPHDAMKANPLISKNDTPFF